MTDPDGTVGAERASLTGTTVLISGAARGLGLAMTRGLAAAGANVVAMDLPSEALTQAIRTSSGNVVAFAGDVTSPEDCEHAVASAVNAFGSLGVLVNNAGIGMHVVRENFLSDPLPFWQLTVAQWEHMTDVNAKGPFLLARAAVPEMLKHGWGRIVNVTTTYVTMTRAGFCPYGSSKAALEADTVIWSRDLAGSGVTVNALLPGGGADTRMITDTQTFPDRSKLIRPEMMVKPVVWLASRSSDGVTGQRFTASNWTEGLAPEVAMRHASPAFGLA